MNRSPWSTSEPDAWSATGPTDALAFGPDFVDGQVVEFWSHGEAVNFVAHVHDGAAPGVGVQALGWYDTLSATITINEVRLTPTAGLMFRSPPAASDDLAALPVLSAKATRFRTSDIETAVRNALSATSGEDNSIEREVQPGFEHLAARFAERDAVRSKLALKVSEAGAPRPGRRGTSDAVLAERAARYAQLCKEGERSPARVMAAEWVVNQRTVHGWIAQARERGLLTPAVRGRPSGDLTSKAEALLSRSDGDRG